METEMVELVSHGETRDAEGRSLVSAARREAVLAAYDRCGGLTQREFARREGVKYNTLVAWLENRRRVAGVARRPAGAKVRFEELQVPAARMAGLEVYLPGGMIVRGHDANQVAALVRALK
jgi:hypothetical protein